MLKLGLAYLTTGAAFAALDFLWLSWATPRLYRPVLGELLAPKVDLGAAVAFYLIYIAGLVLFAVRPALEDGRWTKALLLGAAVGVLAYATYDLTNQATLRVWSIRVTLADIAWGAFASAAAASAGFKAARLVG